MPQPPAENHLADRRYVSVVLRLVLDQHGQMIHGEVVGDATTRPGFYRAPLAGGAAERLYTGQLGALAGFLATAGEYVFFGMSLEDRILRHKIGSGAYADPP